MAAPCSLGAGLGVFEAAKPKDGSVSHCAAGGGGAWIRSTEKKGFQRRAARRGLFWEHLQARPTPLKMGLRLVCVRDPVLTRPSQAQALKPTAGKKIAKGDRKNEREREREKSNAEKIW